MLDLGRLTYDELVALAEFFKNIGRTEEADVVYDYLGEELLNGLAEE